MNQVGRQRIPLSPENCAEAAQLGLLIEEEVDDLDVECRRLRLDVESLTGESRELALDQLARLTGYRQERAEEALRLRQAARMGYVENA